MTSEEPSENPKNSRHLCFRTIGISSLGYSAGFACMQPLIGRYVTVLMYFNHALTFCEMQVFGVPLPENWDTPERIYPPAVVHMDGVGLSKAHELKDGQETCPDTHFQCARGFCIPTYLLNNGITDCPSGEDEHIADLSCPGFFRCWTEGTCLHPVYYCDGVNHCPFNEDERYCGQEHCPDQCVCEGLAFRCWSGLDYQAHFQLRYLDLSGSNNPDLKGTEILTYLQHLNLSSSGMKEVKLSYLSQLRILDVSHNSIHRFDSLKLSYLPELLHLNLSFNPLSRMMDPDFSNFVQKAAFVKLQSLVMMDVGLETIKTEGLRGSAEITVLDIRHNPVNTLPTKVLGKSIRVLYTDNLKLCCPHFHMTQLAECHAPLDELSSCSDLLKSDFLRVLLWVLSVMAVVGNVGVWVYRTFIEQQGTSLAFKVMVINLSASDFLMGVYMTIIGATDILFRGVYVLKEEQWRHTVVCKTAGFLAIVSSEMSAFVICLITLDRFLLLRFPFSVRLRLSKLSASVACCLIWMAAAVLASLPLFVPHWEFYSQNSICVPLPITQRQFPGQHYAFGVFIVLNFIISSVIGVGQVLIYHTIHQTSRGLQKDSRNQEIAIARRLFLIVVTDFCCWFPIGLMGLLAARGARISDHVNVWAAVFVMPLNSALNPFLYTLNTLLERRARHVEHKRMEKIMANIHVQMRTWPGERMLEHVRKCLSLNLVAKEDVLELADHCPECGHAGKDDMKMMMHRDQSSDQR